MNKAYLDGYASNGSFYDNPYSLDKPMVDTRLWIDGKVQAMIDATATSVPATTPAASSSPPDPPSPLPVKPTSGPNR